MGKIDNNDFGSATVGAGTSQERKMPIVNAVQLEFIDHRLITVAELQDKNGFIIAVENPKSSERNTHVNMWLSEESFVGALTAMSIFAEKKGMAKEEYIREHCGEKPFNVAVFGLEIKEV